MDTLPPNQSAPDPVPAATLESGPAPSDGSIDLLELISIFIVEWRRVLLVTVLGLLLGTWAVYRIKPEYEADALLLPQTSSSSSTNSAAAAFLSIGSSSDVFIGLLGSRSVADEVIVRQNLLALYKVKTQQQARGLLASRSKFAEDKNGMITVTVRDLDAGNAQRITNAYLDALVLEQERMSGQAAEQRSQFFQQQLAREANALERADEDLKQVQEKTGLVQPDAQTSIGINAIASARAQITNLQVELSSLLLSETEQNPQVKALRAQIAQLEAQAQRQESSGGNAGTGVAASASRMPALNLDYARKLRAVRYHEGLFSSISTQYENARLSENFSGVPFSIVDRAVAPETKAYPNRRSLMELVLAGSVLAGFVFVALTLFWRRLISDPRSAEHLRTMGSSFLPRRNVQQKA